MVALLTLFAGCTQSVCEGRADEEDKEAPRIWRASLLRTKEETGDPWTLIFSFDVEGSHLEGGALQSFTPSSSKGEQQRLDELLARSEVPPADSINQRRMVSFASEMLIARRFLVDGSLLRLGFMLRDGSRRTSNCYTLDLEFAVRRNQAAQ